VFTDDQIVLISALEHYSYCPRQCGLIHVESVFDENVFTIRGRIDHKRVDEAESTLERGIRIERSIPLWSDELGLYGKSDVVEFHSDGSIIPVEYKHGTRQVRTHDDVQLCGQALCLEEMYGREVPIGAVYSTSTHRRRIVEFTEEIREHTMEIICSVRDLVAASGPLPPAFGDARCNNCSLIGACVPETILKARQKRLVSELYSLPKVD